MANFLESILGASTDVYITVSQTNWVEMAVMDKRSKTFKSYARATIEYNEAKREIADYEMLRTKIEKLYEECNVQPQNSNVYMCLPTVWFGFKDNLPLLLGDEDIKNVVLSELEQTYLFKTSDPVPFYFEAPSSLDAETKSVFYTAIQSQTLDAIMGMFKELGANLVRVDISLFADLRALITSGLAEVEMNADTSHWTLMIVNNSGFQLFGLECKNIAHYYEEPIPIKSYDEEEIYSAIDNAAQVALMSSPPETLVIVSETDEVSANKLSKRLQFSGKLVVVEDNKYRKTPLSDITQSLIPELQSEVSLQMIGMLTDRHLYPVDLNFLLSMAGYSRTDVLEIPLGNGKVLTLTKRQAMIYSIIIFLLVVIPFGIGYGASSMINNKYVSQNEEIESELAEVNSQLKTYQNEKGSGFDPYQEIQQVLKFNRTKVMAYAALGDSIPKNVYLTYFMTGDKGYIDIQGCSNSVEDIYIFFQNLKDSLIESKLRLSKLDLKSGSLDDMIENPSPLDKAPYVFEITNMDEGQLASFMDALRNVGQNQNNNGQGQDQGQNQNQDQSQQNQNGSTNQTTNSTQNQQ